MKTHASHHSMPETLLIKAKKKHIRPFLTALVFSLTYLAVCSLYIWSSSKIAAVIALSKEDLQKIETYKGLAFIILTTLFLFVILLILLRKIRRSESRLILQQNDLLEAKRLSLAGLFASSTAHDINNILQIMDHYCGADDYPDNRNHLTLSEKKHVVKAIDDLKALTRRLMTVGRRSRPEEKQRLSLDNFIRETIAFVKKHARLSTRRIDFKTGEPVEISASPTVLRLLLINLILNAASASGEQGEIDISLTRNNSMVTIEICDNGPGIPRAMRKKIFEPFHSTREDGTGLGLLSVKAYVSAMEGNISVGDSQSGGARFTINLPEIPSGNEKMNINQADN